MNGASVVRILSARAGKTGTVTASGRVRYRGVVARGVIPGID